MYGLTLQNKSIERLKIDRSSLSLFVEKTMFIYISQFSLKHFYSTCIGISVS